MAPHLGRPSPFKNQGKRVIIGQRMIQGSPDIFLGWGPGNESSIPGHYYVRQLADMKGGTRFAAGDKESLKSLSDYCRLCGWALALAHAKSGDPAMISGYCGIGDALPDAISHFALSYVEQTERDHSALEVAVHRLSRVQLAKYDQF